MTKDPFPEVSFNQYIMPTIKNKLLGVLTGKKYKVWKDRASIRPNIGMAEMWKLAEKVLKQLQLIY